MESLIGQARVEAFLPGDLLPAASERTGARRWACWRWWKGNAVASGVYEPLGGWTSVSVVWVRQAAVYEVPCYHAPSATAEHFA
jgi:hypothetical protein